MQLAQGDHSGRAWATVAERLVSTDEAARALNVHPVTLRRWMKAGIVKAADTTAGGHARWDVEQLRQQVREYRNRR